jgi:hypothetical protein
MKTSGSNVARATILALMLAPLACSSSTDTGSPGTGGTDAGGTGSGGSSPKGGTGGGSSATGGSSSTGGSSGSGGSTGTGGSPATGGGGTPGAGGSTPATGGSGGGAGTGGAAGDAGAAETGGPTGANTITGMYGSVAIKPVMSGLWIGKPEDPGESGGGPFVVLFSAPVTCADIAQSGWIAKIPAGTQVMELIIGTTQVGKQIKQAGGAGANVVEVNYTFGASSLVEHKSTSGNLTLTSYKAGMAVEGTLDINFGVGMATGAFHADYCADGVELSPP